MLKKGIKGVYIFRSSSGITLFSKRNINIQEDFLSAFMSAIREFFDTLSLGGLSTFSTDSYIFYLASVHNVCATIIVDLQEKSDSYFDLCFEICSQFYNRYKTYLNKDALHIPDSEKFESVIDELILQSEENFVRQKELIRLYELSKSNELQQFNFVNEDQLFNKDLFIAVNLVTKKIYVVENADFNVPNRKLYLANKEVTSLNQIEFRSDFSINNLSDIWDLERITGVIKNVLTGTLVEI